MADFSFGRGQKSKKCSPSCVCCELRGLEPGTVAGKSTPCLDHDPRVNSRSTRSDGRPCGGAHGLDRSCGNDSSPALRTALCEQRYFVWKNSSLFYPMPPLGKHNIGFLKKDFCVSIFIFYKIYQKPRTTHFCTRKVNLKFPFRIL